ncbi:hypothetical protein FRC09_003019 [Ceratobasidium sp. 395]|nr:hypothetical protein FRC09_003019 [Ceratobasidium sp. 395]
MTYLLITTLLCITLILLGIPAPAWLNNRIQRTTQLFREHAFNTHGSSTEDWLTTNKPITWVAQSMLSLSRSILDVDLNGVRRTLTPHLYDTPIAGAWTEYSVAPTGLNLTLSRNIVFPSKAPKHMFILSSSNNGYLNSRIDLRRRKRAFNKGALELPTQPMNLLHLRDDAMFQPRNIDQGVLMSQLHEAIRRHQEIEKDNIARKLRKARKKKVRGSNTRKNT